jgi:hypothetical protein
MPHTIADRVHKWSMDAKADTDYLSLFAQIEYLGQKRFGEYEPTIFPPHKDFFVRLRDWLNNAIKEEDQQTLLRLVSKIFFVGSKEFESLYRSAYREILIRWLIEENSLTLNDSTLDSKIEAELKCCWFCPITDSMKVSTFYHVNNITGIDLRPDWRTLRKFAEPQKISQHMQKTGIRRIVLLEDFVCTSSQAGKAIEYAANLPGSPPLLVIPLIVCPAGLTAMNSVAAKYSQVKIVPTLILNDDAFVVEAPQVDELPLIDRIRRYVTESYPLVVGGIPVDYTKEPFGPFGFGNSTPRKGALVVMYTNTPDNTLPLIHHKSATWKPLFPRSSRT